MSKNWKYQHYVEQIRRTFHVTSKKKYRIKKHENFVITSLVHDSRLKELKPLTQFYVKRKDKGYALIDLYYPQLNLAIEIDEAFHDNNEEADTLRQNIVSAELDCDFYRIKISERNVLEKIEDLKLKLVNRKEKFLKNKSFEEWSEPKYLNLSEAKKEFKNTLFIKIKGEIHPDDLWGRQTCCWAFAEWKLDAVNKIIIVHDKMITRVFENPKFRRTTDKKKFCYSADEIQNHELLGSQIVDWNYQRTWTYSLDIG